MDCLEGMQEIPDKSIDLVITDPPYGIGESTKKRENNITDKWKNPYKKIHNPLDWDNKVPNDTYFDELIRISKNQIIWGANHFISKIPFDSPCWLVWDKKNGACDFADCELAWTSFDTAVRKFEYLWVGYRKEEPEERIHPTQKPVKLFEWIIKNYAKEGDTICDPFFGSGSCLVAAVRMGHPFIGFEKESTYFEKAQIRIKNAQEQGKIGSWFEEGATA